MEFNAHNLSGIIFILIVLAFIIISYLLYKILIIFEKHLKNDHK